MVEIKYFGPQSTLEFERLIRNFINNVKFVNSQRVTNIKISRNNNTAHTRANLAVHLANATFGEEISIEMWG